MPACFIMAGCFNAGCRPGKLRVSHPLGVAHPEFRIIVKKGIKYADSLMLLFIREHTSVVCVRLLQRQKICILMFYLPTKLYCFLLCPALLMNSAFAQKKIVIRPVEINDVLINPGMGLTTFQMFNGDNITPFHDVLNEADLKHLIKVKRKQIQTIH